MSDFFTALFGCGHGSARGCTGDGGCNVFWWTLSIACSVLLISLAFTSDGSPASEGFTSVLEKCPEYGYFGLGPILWGTISVLANPMHDTGVDYNGATFGMHTYVLALVCLAFGGFLFCMGPATGASADTMRSIGIWGTVFLSTGMGCWLFSGIFRASLYDLRVQNYMAYKYNAYTSNVYGLSTEDKFNDGYGQNYDKYCDFVRVCSTYRNKEGFIAKPKEEVEDWNCSAWNIDFSDRDVRKGLHTDFVDPDPADLKAWEKPLVPGTDDAAEEHSRRERRLLDRVHVRPSMTKLLEQIDVAAAADNERV